MDQAQDYGTCPRVYFYSDICGGCIFVCVWRAESDRQQFDQRIVLFGYSEVLLSPPFHSPSLPLPSPPLPFPPLPPLPTKLIHISSFFLSLAFFFFFFVCSLTWTNLTTTGTKPGARDMASGNLIGSSMFMFGGYCGTAIDNLFKLRITLH